jgi:hypothetical protein
MPRKFRDERAAVLRDPFDCGAKTRSGSVWAIGKMQRGLQNHGIKY